MREAGATKARLQLRDLFSKEKAARGFDINLAIKSSKSGWVLGAAVGFGLVPFYPPTARIGAAGWPVVAVARRWSRCSCCLPCSLATRAPLLRRMRGGITRPGALVQRVVGGFWEGPVDRMLHRMYRVSDPLTVEQRGGEFPRPTR